MATDGFGAFVGNLDPSNRRLGLELKRLIVATDDRLALYVPLAGGTMTGDLYVPNVRATSSLYVGDDARLLDINVAHTVGVQSQSDATRASLKLGSSGPSFHGLPSYFHVQSPDVGYLDANTLYMRSAAGSDYGRMASDGMHLKDGSWFRTYGSAGWYNGTWGGGWYMADATWIRAYNGKWPLADRWAFDGTGYKFTNSTDTDTGIYYDSDGVWRLMSNGGTELHIQPNIISIFNGHRIRLYDSADDNHHLRYSSDSAATIHPSSGVGSNGPWLQGYSTVCLRTVVSSRTWLFDSSGNAFTPNSWTTYSSIVDKDNVESLDPEDCLDQVRLWRPVSYERISDGQQSEGFVAEEMLEVTPKAVAVVDGTVSGIDYSKLTVQLSGAVQALLARIEQLEARITELEAQ